MVSIRKQPGGQWLEVKQLPRPRFGQLAREMFDVGRTELDSCLGEQRAAGDRTGAILRRRGVLERQQIKCVLQAQARWTVSVAEALYPCRCFPLRSSLSLCLPAYNEAANIEDTLDGACAVLGEAVEDYRIIVADDGSRDGTGEILARYAENEPRLQVVTHPRNLGYGAALTSALRAVRSDLACILDSDGQFNPLNVLSLLCRLRDRAVVIGYRSQRADNRLRRFDAWAWNRLIRFVLGVPVRDLDCAFKLFAREVLEDVELSSRGACITRRNPRAVLAARPENRGGARRALPAGASRADRRRRRRDCAGLPRASPPLEAPLAAADQRRRKEKGERPLPAAMVG